MPSFLGILLFFLFPISFSLPQRSSWPNALVLRVTKDASTLQYVTIINQRTPLVPVTFVVDLGGRYLWVDCDSGYISSSYRSAHCNSAQCSLANAAKGCKSCFAMPRPGCNNNTCVLFSENAFVGMVSPGDLGEDILALQSTNGLSPGPVASVPRFLFSCAQTFLIKGLASSVNGMVGLGRSRIAFPEQLSATFKFSRKFALCLPPSTMSSGVMFFGDGPYGLLPGIDVSKLLSYTPLIVNPISTAKVSYKGERSYEYFIGVKSIRINGKKVSFNPSLLSINKEGIGGTKISTVNPYTVLETSIYKAVTMSFLKEAENVTRVAPVAPFGVCFSPMNTRPTIPVIDLVMQSKEIFWRIFETNSVVQVTDTVACLGIVDGGSNARTSIVIGGYQLEDNLLQFDLVGSRLGFSSSLLLRETSCGNFNFTSIA
ncbi:hypothetical protein HHK36_012589 [Tetracentron sinense]|uniref:Peptidase A1 domain-containing protein n=1 Tax=Tetracentron sinense TaxID=13715 RepID=A0A835DEQ9_TETSI|nr:hypothetical protein HHK36_012589 [Tetracentron sinense]